MKKIDLLPKGNYYKSNLHCHTTFSDGEWTPQEVKEQYRERGYSIVAITDHNRYINHRELNDDSFLALAAYEVDINESIDRNEEVSRMKACHINLYDTNPEQNIEKKEKAMRPIQNYGDFISLNHYIAQMNEMGFLACYNHPYWSLETYDDYKELRGLWGMEIYNHGCELDGHYGYNPQSYDELLRNGHRIFCVATDDNHNRFDVNHPFSDAFGGFTMIRGEQLSYQEIIRSMENGWFYSSMGPEIYEVSLIGKQLKIQTSPAESIYVITEGRDCLRAAAPEGETITEAEFTITGKEGYLRLDVVDEKRRHANTNAYYLDDIFRKVNELYLSNEN